MVTGLRLTSAAAAGGEGKRVRSGPQKDLVEGRGHYDDDDGVLGAWGLCVDQTAAASGKQKQGTTWRVRAVGGFVVGCSRAVASRYRYRLRYGYRHRLRPGWVRRDVMYVCNRLIYAATQCTTSRMGQEMVEMELGLGWRCEEQGRRKEMGRSCEKKVMVVVTVTVTVERTEAVVVIKYGVNGQSKYWRVEWLWACCSVFSPSVLVLELDLHAQTPIRPGLSKQLVFLQSSRSMPCSPVETAGVEQNCI